MNEIDEASSVSHPQLLIFSYSPSVTHGDIFEVLLVHGRLQMQYQHVV
jgi:hypothetical protein